METLLPRGDVSALAFEIKKLRAFWCTAAITAGPYVLLWFPFLVTHVLPAAVIFFPEVAALLLLAAAAWIPLGVCQRCQGHGTKMWPVQLERSGGLRWLPLLLIAAALSELLMLQATYFYSGDSYFDSIAEALLERRVYTYLQSFQTRILSHFYTTVDLVNEAT